MEELETGTLGESLPNVELVPEVKPESATTVIVETGKALEEVKKLELAGMSDALQILTETAANLKTLATDLQASLLEVGNMKAELAETLAEAKVSAEVAEIVTEIVKEEAKETVQAKKKMRLW